MQLHLHWSNSSKAGAEHQVEGVEFPMELHLVHKNTKYKDLTEALGHDDGLAVVGILFKVTQPNFNGDLFRLLLKKILDWKIWMMFYRE